MVTFGRLDIFLLNFFFNRYIFGLILQQENLIVFEKAQSFMNFVKFPFRLEIHPNNNFVVLFCQILILVYPYETLCSQLSGVLFRSSKKWKKLTHPILLHFLYDEININLKGSSWWNIGLRSENPPWFFVWI